MDENEGEYGEMTGMKPEDIRVGPKSSPAVVVLTLFLGAASSVMGFLAMVSAHQVLLPARVYSLPLDPSGTVQAEQGPH